MRFTGLTSSLVALAGLAGCAAEPDSLGSDTDALTRDQAAFLAASLHAVAPTTQAIPLAQAAAVVGLDDVCPAARQDELCVALRAGDDARSRTLAAARLVGTERLAGQADPAVRYYLRERQVALLVWNALTERGRHAPPASYAAAATAFLDEHCPADQGDLTHFAMARRGLAPLDGTGCTSDDTIVYFPGVLRIQDRTEFRLQTQAIAEALPCLETIVVDTEDFMDPSVNAAVAKRQIDALGAVPTGIHLIGYSQGVRNVLQTLVEYPDLAARSQSVLTMNSAAHGSEAIDTLFLAMQAFERVEDICAAVPAFARAACEEIKAQSPVPADVILGLVGDLLSVPADRIVDGIEGADPARTIELVREYVRSHLAGWRSLTTFDSKAFWAQHGATLPKDLLYFAFRSAISDTEKNLPLSNAPLYFLLAQAGGADPYNDMQVRLSNQALGGPVAGTEVVLPAAEGNHWQWEFTKGQLDSALIPDDMIERVPQLAYIVSYTQVLFEAGYLN
jgi:pimeloyl-ACP methyl ester carboxylesterase